jgi:ABC-type phosphate/phosphonate transport system substrate-binding protein
MRAMISMYEFPEQAEALDDWWGGLARHWRAAGLSDVPAERTPIPGELYDFWMAPDLFIAQTCGYPLTHRLKGQVTVVATPCYRAEGSVGPTYLSLFVTRKDSGVLSVREFAGKTLAINGYDSQSGWHALRHALKGRGKPDQVIETGGHRNSIAAVREKRADVASIDNVTFALLQRDVPWEVDSLRIVGQSASAPALPFVTRRDISASDLQKLRDGLMAAAGDPALNEARAALLLKGFEVLPGDAYHRILEMEREAGA